MAWGKAGSSGLGEVLYRLKHGHDSAPSPRYREKNAAGTVSDITSTDWDTAPTGILVEEWTGNQTASAPSWASDMWSGSTSSINGHSITARRYIITTATAGNGIAITGMTESKTNEFLHHMITPSTNLSVNGHFNDAGSNYADRCEFSGGTDTTAVSQDHFNQDGDTGNDDDRFTVWYWCNVAGEEKLGIGHMVNRNTAGAGNVPPRAQMASKYTVTSGQFTEVAYVASTGTLGTDSNLTALGSDLTPTAGSSFPTNVQVGSRAEITDSRKMYNFSDTSKSKLKAYYHFEDNGTNAQTTGDGLGSSADMTITGATYVTGKVGSKAISFDGTNDYAVIGSSTSDFNFLANTTHEWTVAFWIKNDDFSSLGMILSTSVELGSSRYGLGIRAQSSGSMYVHFSNGTNTNRFTTTQTGFSTDGNWHFIVITAKKSDSTNSLEFWQDGVSLGTASNSGKDFVDTNASQAPYIGQAGDSSQYLDGALDELSIWNRRLTDAEIATLYNSGTGQVIVDGMSKSWQEIGA